MPRPHVAAAVLATALGTTALAGCGPQGLGAARPSSTTSQPPAAAGSPSPSPTGDRAALLATCPAQAPGWLDDSPVPAGVAGEIQQRRSLGLRSDEDYVRALDAAHAAAVAADPSAAEGNADWARYDSWRLVMTAAEEQSIWQRQADVEPALAMADRYLRSLPDDQAGQVRSDALHGRIVVQVTRDAQHVRAQLQRRVGDDAIVVVETVRYSSAELKHLAAAIWALDGLHLSEVGWGTGNDRVEVSVTEDPDRARTRIARLADPCAFTVTVGQVTALAAAPAPG